MKQDLSFYDVIKSVLVAGLHRHATNLCVEVGRQAAPDHVRPSFVDVENALRLQPPSPSTHSHASRAQI